MDWRIILFIISFWARIRANQRQPSSCGCTTETLPHPRIVLLGPTGVGKSTFGNRLFGITEYNDKEAICSQHGNQKPIKFGVGHRSESHTVITSWMVGHYLGDPNNPCITIIDTPGTGDTEGRDCDHGIALAKGIKEVGSIDAFMLLFKGSNPRFSQSMQEQIHLYTNIFGDDLFKNAITEFTYWSHDRRSILKRKRTRDGLNEEIQHQTWNKEYADRLQVPRKIETVFVDPVFDEEIADDNEIEKFKENTDKLWDLLTKKFKPFECKKNCKAPSGFFSGQPWLFEENVIQNRRLKDRATITVRIWFAGCDGKGTKSYKIYFKSATDSVARVIYEYVVVDDEKETKDDSKLLKSMKVTDETADKFKIIRMTIDSVDEEHFGQYFVENDKGQSKLSNLNKIVDGTWVEWDPYGDCSKTCIKGNEKPGNMERTRKCNPPQNGGLECKGKNKETKACAHKHGENADIFRQCPVDAAWSAWASGWSKCSANCLKKGESLPTKTRSRVCQPERFGGKTCKVLEKEATEKKLALYEEEQDCTSLPNCPKPASLSPWSEWSQCSVTCYPENESVPQSVRSRTCKKALLSSSSALNADVLTCQALGEMNAYKNCEIPACPVPAEWQNWREWGACSTTCGKGSRTRSRSFTSGRNGANTMPDGDQTQREACNQYKKCPVPAIWTWGDWTSCDIDCYKPDGYRGIRTREQHCKEGSPVHPYLNCNYPPAPGRVDTQRGCPDLPRCSPLTRVYAKMNDKYNAGTDASVYLKLKSGELECETETLDSAGNSWQTGGTEDFRGGDELKPCKNFYPSPKHSLKFNLALRSSDGLLVEEVLLEFGSKTYKWTGKDWFNKEFNQYYPRTLTRQ